MNISPTNVASPIRFDGIPSGFSKLEEISAATRHWAPLYSRKRNGCLDVGLFVGDHHCNSSGFASGGMLAALADLSMGHTCLLQQEEGARIVTVNLSMDYLGIGRQGEWLEFRSQVDKAARTLCFIQCQIMANERPCARATATFQIRARERTCP